MDASDDERARLDIAAARRRDDNRDAINITNIKCVMKGL